MFSKTEIKKTTDWLKKNGTQFEVHDDGVHVDGKLTVPQGKKAKLPALVKSGYVDVSENATFEAPALVKSGSVYVRENATFEAPALVTIGNVAFKTEMFGHKVEVHDGIGAVAICEKTRDGITIRRCRKAKFEERELVGNKMYVVSLGEHNAHGETLDAALSDLSYKTAARDISTYQNMPMDTIKPPYEWATVYRVVTGACQMGTEDFIKSQGDLKENYTLSEIIDLTRNAYGSERFREVVA